MGESNYVAISMICKFQSLFPFDLVYTNNTADIPAGGLQACDDGYRANSTPHNLDLVVPQPD